MEKEFCYKCNKYYENIIIYNRHLIKKPHLKNVQKWIDEHAKDDAKGEYKPYNQD